MLLSSEFSEQYLQHSLPNCLTVTVSHLQASHTAQLLLLLFLPLWQRLQLLSSACVALCWNGSSCICVTEYFKSFAMSCPPCHKIQYSACGCLLRTSLTLNRRLISTAWIITLLPTSCSKINIVIAMLRRLLSKSLNTVSQISINGCWPTACRKLNPEKTALLWSGSKYKFAE